MRLVAGVLMGLACAGACGPASAQLQDCVGRPGRVYCTDSLNAVVDRMQAQIRDRKPAGPAEVAQSADGPEVLARPQPILTPEQQRLVDAVAKAVRAGRCDKAESIAVKAGDLALAEQAVRLCVPAAKSP